MHTSHRSIAPQGHDHGSGDALVDGRLPEAPPTRSFRLEQPRWPGLNAEDSALLNRFFRKVRFDETGCWIWQGSLHGDGYGLMCIRQKTERAHRVSYVFFVGPIRGDLTIDHLCRNRACVNPAHLEPVTRAENLRRGWASRRQAAS